MVVFPEFNVDLALGDGRLPDVLQLFEGEGAAIKPNLYRPYAETTEESFADTFFLLASNRFPEWACQSKFPQKYAEQWVPLMSRVELVMLSESFLGTPEFPYSAQVLAGAIKQAMAEHKENAP